MKLAISVFLILHMCTPPATSFNVTLRSQEMSKVGREEWIVQERIEDWDEHVAIIIVDMWDKHWCPSATSRVAEIAVPINATVSAARELGVTIIHAPSDVTNFYNDSAARRHTLSLRQEALPRPRNVSVPPFPLDTSTDGGCDFPAKMGSSWKRQIETIRIDAEDFLIASEEGKAEVELYSILSAKKIRNLLYVGVHENMCIMGRPFAIEKVVSWGYNPRDLGVIRELVDVMYTPKNVPYVSHAEGLRLHTEYIEKFWASSISMYDILAHKYDSPDPQRAAAACNYPQCAPA